MTQLKAYAAEGVGIPIEDEPKRVRRVLRAFLMRGMLYYVLIVLVVSSTWIAFTIGWIR